MSEGPRIKLESGTIQAAASRPTPALKKAEDEGRRAILQVQFGGWTIISLVAIYAVSLCCNVEKSQEILIVIGSGLGYLLGNRYSAENTK